MTKAEAKVFEDRWNEARNTMNKELLWKCVFDCAKHSLLKYYNSKGIHFNDVDELSMDITIKCFEDINRKGWYPDSLAAFVYYRLLAVVLDKKKQFNDRILYSDDAMTDYMMEKNYEVDYLSD